jgi:hypothetical protein
MMSLDSCVLLIVAGLAMNQFSARPANGRYPRPSDEPMDCILECAAAAKSRVSCASPFDTKMFAEAGVWSVIFARSNMRAPGTNHFNQ